MKKWLTLALALVMALCMVSGAMAASLELIREDSRDLVWLDGTDLLLVKPEGEFHSGSVYNVNGEQVSDKVFSSSAIFGGRFTYGCVTEMGEGLNRSGLMSNDGRLVVPCEYGDVIIFENWAIAVKLEKWDGEDYDYREFWDSEVHYGIVQADVYVLPEGKKVASLAREQYADASAHNDRINIMDRSGAVKTYDANFAVVGDVRNVYSDDLFVFDYSYVTDTETYADFIVDAQGNKITTPIYNGYSEAEFDDGYCVVCSDETDLYGFINTQGVEVVPCAYEEVESMFSLPYVTYRGNTYAKNFGGYAVVSRDDQVAYVSLETGKETTAFIPEDDVEVNGLSFEIEGEDDSVTILTCTGVQNTYTEAQYSDFDVLMNTAGRLYRVAKETEDYHEYYGVIDMEGNELLPCTYSYDIKASGSGNYLLVGTQDEMYRIYKVTY